MSKTIAQQLNITDFPFEIRDKEDRLLYIENADGFCAKWEYDSNGNQIYFEHSKGYSSRWEYDSDGKERYFEDSKGIVRDKRSKETSRDYNSGWKYDSDGRVILPESVITDGSTIQIGDGKIIVERPKETITLNGIKYQRVEE